tara:strand:+ start:543 stop:698 length:156 start_codon:yes stop_codon:yes gene_type:complete
MTNYYSLWDKFNRTYTVFDEDGNLAYSAAIYDPSDEFLDGTAVGVRTTNMW